MLNKRLCVCVYPIDKQDNEENKNVMWLMTSFSKFILLVLEQHDN